MSLSESQKTFTESMRCMYPGLFPVSRDEDCAINSFGIEVFPGWFPVVEDMLGRIAKYVAKIDLIPQIYIMQIKRDFCSLRCEFNEYNSDLVKIVGSYTVATSKICEQCGSPGTFRAHRRWKMILCDACDAAKKDAFR